MRPAPAMEALAGLSFNGVTFAADMAMFSFGPERPKVLQFGPRKGETIFVGSHSLHVQCFWRLYRGTSVVANAHGKLISGATEPATGRLVDRVEAEDGSIVLTLGEYRLEVVPDRTDEEQWRLLTGDPDEDHLVWGGEDGPPH